MPSPRRSRPIGNADVSPPPSTTVPEYPTYRLPYPRGLVQRRGRQERGDVSRELHARNVTAVTDELHFEDDPVVVQ